MPESVRQLRKFFELYLNSSIHVALAVTAFTEITHIYLQLPRQPGLLVFVFFSTITGYNITKYGGELDRIFDPSLSVIRYITIVAGAGSFLSAFFISLPVLLTAIVLGLITLSYSWPLILNKSMLREISGIKIVVISFIWSSVSVGLPVLEANMGISTQMVLEFIQRFIFVLVLTLPFDIRDVRFDTYQMATIPQLIGIKTARLLGVGLLAVCVCIELFKEPLELSQLAVFIVISIFAGGLLMKTVVQQTRYFASFWVEGLPIFWWLLIVLFN